MFEKELQIMELISTKDYKGIVVAIDEFKVFHVIYQMANMEICALSYLSDLEAACKLYCLR